jgi:hypothetical protein
VMECHPADLVRHMCSFPEVTRTSGKTEIYSCLYSRDNHHPGEETNQTQRSSRLLDIEIYIFHHHHIYIIHIYTIHIFNVESYSAALGILVILSTTKKTTTTETETAQILLRSSSSRSSGSATGNCSRHIFLITATRRRTTS